MYNPSGASHTGGSPVLSLARSPPLAVRGLAGRQRKRK